MREHESLLAQVCVVLVRPKYLENIGAAARAACTMGVGGLAIVGTKPDDLEPALKTATHNAASLIQGIVYYDTIGEALAGYSLVVGTTARRGRQRMAMAKAADVAMAVVPALRQGPVALVFGPEDTGLSNLELSLCGLVVTIPTASRFSSINLAQAVMIVCYELYQGSERIVGQVGDHGIYQPRLASIEEISAMMVAATCACQALDYGFGRKKADLRLRHLRQAVCRTPFTAREIKLMKDICRQVVARISPPAGEEQ